MAPFEPGTCQLCGCTDGSPCLGGVLFPAAGAGPGPRRMVDDPGLLAPGETCCWMDEEETVCSAHRVEDLVEAGMEVGDVADSTLDE